MNRERKTYDNPQQLRQYRKQLYQDAIRRGPKPDRVPIFSNVWTWKFLDAGYSLRDCIYNFDNMFDATCEHHEKYEMDLYIDYGTRNPLIVTDCYGPSQYKIDDEKNYISFNDFCLMDEDDYDVFLQDGVIKFFFERGVPKRYGITDPEDMIVKYGKAAHVYQQLTSYQSRISNQFIENYGVPNIGMGKPLPPIDYMINGMRGLTGTAMDMRRQPEKLDAALNLLDEFLYPAVQSSFAKYDPDSDKYAMFARITSLAHTMLNPKQFVKYGFPFYKKFCEDVAARDWCAWMFFEGSSAHLFDILRDIPEGHFAFMIEQDDPVVVKKALPNLTVCGGFDNTLLQNGTKEQCIDRAKKMVDELAYDGRYIFASAKMMSYPQDGKGENYQAVIDFVKQYGKF